VIFFSQWFCSGKCFWVIRRHLMNYLLGTPEDWCLCPERRWASLESGTGGGWGAVGCRAGGVGVSQARTVVEMGQRKEGLNLRVKKKKITPFTPSTKEMTELGLVDSFPPYNRSWIVMIVRHGHFIFDYGATGLRNRPSAVHHGPARPPAPSRKAPGTQS